LYYYADWTNKVSWQYFDYLKNFDEVWSTAECTKNVLLNKKPADFNLAWNVLTITKYKSYTYDCWWEWNSTCCGFIKDKVTVYKFIDTRIKHTEPTSDTLSGMSVATRARPVDGKNYISFLGVWGDTIKLDYPDIFSVDVYYKSGNKLILKTPDQIDWSIRDYLKNLVKTYNQKLQAELDKKQNFLYIPVFFM